MYALLKFQDNSPYSSRKTELKSKVFAKFIKLQFGDCFNISHFIVMVEVLT